MALAYVNGRLIEEADAELSVFDHGLVVGDGVFETVLVWRGRPFALEAHLDRLARSAAGLGIGPVSRRELHGAAAAVVEAAGLAEARLRITVTAGRGPLGSARQSGPPSIIVALEPLGEPHEHAAVHVVPWTRNERGALAGLKTTSYAENALALARATSEGADEAIFANTAAMLCEGTGSNVFVVLDGELCTPPLSSGCLAGVTRALVLAHHGGTERDVPIAAFRAEAVEEAFLTSSLRGVQPISAIDKAALAWPGPVTKQVAATYAALLETPAPSLF
ncbi:MAG: aminotransferase class IV [Actinomycetota bacterium]|nr:aminotransferase class IV [Actinomycetota bacterium]